MNDQEELNQEYELSEDFKDELEKRASTNKEKADEFSLLTSKWLFLINGAALTSVTAMIIQLAGKEENKNIALAFLDSASSFQVGLLTILLAVMMKPLLYTTIAARELTNIIENNLKKSRFEKPIELAIAFVELVSFLACVYGFTIFIRTTQTILSS